MGLAEQVHETIAKAREKASKPNPDFDATQEAIDGLRAWMNGMEDALQLIAVEVEKLTAAK